MSSLYLSYCPIPENYQEKCSQQLSQEISDITEYKKSCCISIVHFWYVFVFFWFVLFCFVSVLFLIRFWFVFVCFCFVSGLFLVSCWFFFGSFFCFCLVILFLFSFLFVFIYIFFQSQNSITVLVEQMFSKVVVSSLFSTSLVHICIKYSPV